MSVQVEYSAFLTDVLPYVRDCPEFVAINAIRNTCIEFCEKSTWWRSTMDPITLVAEQGEYDLDVEVGTGVAVILAAHLGWRPLTIAAPEVITETLGADWRTRPGPVQYITQDGDFATVRLAQPPATIPSNETELVLHVALRPLKSSTRVPKELYERWSEIIGFGARARLHDTPGQPYANAEAAREYRKWFQSGIGEAKMQANRGRGRAVLTVRPPRIV